MSSDQLGLAARPVRLPAETPQARRTCPPQSPEGIAVSFGSCGWGGWHLSGEEMDRCTCYGCHPELRPRRAEVRP
jgi:hypothetical protein